MQRWGSPILAMLLVAAMGVACQRQQQTSEPQQAQPSQPAQGGSMRPEVLVVGLTPFLPEGDLQREFSPLVQYLGQAVGLPTEIRRATSYADLSRLFSRREVHFAVMSPFAYVRAKRENPGLVLLATQIADGSSTYAGYIVARDDSGLESVSDLAGKRFLFVDRNSASGYLYPLAYLRALQLEPETFFGIIGFGANHPNVLEQVLQRQADAGAVASPVFRMFRSERPEGKRLKILAKTGRIPYDAYCASGQLDPELVEKMRAALLRLNTRTEEGRGILRGLTAINGFVAVGDEHYDEVRRVQRLAEDTSPDHVP